MVKKENPVKRFAHNVKKGGRRMKKGLIAAGAAAVTGLIGVIALAAIGAKEPDEYVDADFEEIESDDDFEPEAEEAKDEEETTEE